MIPVQRLMVGCVCVGLATIMLGIVGGALIGGGIWWLIDERFG